MEKRFIALSVIALVMTSSSAAFAELTQPSSVGEGQQVVRQATVEPEVISTPPTKEVVPISGPVVVSSLKLGPVVSQEAAPLGSVQWLVEEKARQDKVESEAERKQRELEAEIAKLKKVASNTETLNEAIADAKKYVGRTFWVLGGSTPRAWDCSGLVRWVYGHLGMDLYHSASVQKFAGTFVDEPVIGDVVAFSHSGHSGAFHVGIVIGPDEMLHSGGKPGDRTEIVSISRWAKGNGKVDITFTRLVETNN